MLRDAVPSPSASLRAGCARETHEWGFCRTRLRRFRPLLAFRRIPYKGLLVSHCLADPDP